jgi:hypothetical protein
MLSLVNHIPNQPTLLRHSIAQTETVLGPDSRYRVRTLTQQGWYFTNNSTNTSVPDQRLLAASRGLSQLATPFIVR